MSNPIFIHVAVEYCVLNLGDPGIEAVETIDVCPGVTAEIVTTPDPYCVTVTVVPIGNGVVILGGNWKFTDELDVNNLTALKLDLNSNVIVSSINYQRYLVICNGYDPVFYYDGTTLEELEENYREASMSI